MADFDFYTVQIFCDGFGNDTIVDSIWRTKEEAENYARRTFQKRGKTMWGDSPFKIVGGRFGKELKLAYNC